MRSFSTLCLVLLLFGACQRGKSENAAQTEACLIPESLGDLGTETKVPAGWVQKGSDVRLTVSKGWGVAGALAISVRRDQKELFGVHDISPSQVDATLLESMPDGSARRYRALSGQVEVKESATGVLVVLTDASFSTADRRGCTTHIESARFDVPRRGAQPPSVAAKP